VISNAYGKNPEMIKEYGQRMKWINQRQREIEAKIKALGEEKEQVNG